MANTRRIIDPKQKIAWGKAFHESPLKRDEFAASVGIVGSQLDVYYTAYKFLNGLEKYNGNSTHQKAQLLVDVIEGKRAAYGRTKKPPKKPLSPEAKARDAERQRLKRAAANTDTIDPMQWAQTNDKQLVPYTSETESSLMLRVKELEDQNEWLQHQCDILNKLLMTVGGTL